MYLSALTKSLPDLRNDNPDRSFATNPDRVFVLYNIRKNLY